MKYLQIIFGLILVLFGLNALFAFLPIPEKQGFALDFLNALHQTKYIFPVVGTIMISVGILLILNRAVSFGLIMLLPVSFNIFAFHLFHDRQGLIAAWAIFALNNFFLVRNRKQFKILFNGVNHDAIKMG